jgi:hypothetical protein
VLKPVNEMFVLSIHDFKNVTSFEPAYENVIIAKSFGEYVLCIYVNVSTKNGIMMSMYVEFAPKTQFAQIQHFFVQQEPYGLNLRQLSFCKGFVFKFLYKLAVDLHKSCGGAVALGNANQIHGSTGNAYFTQLFNEYVTSSRIPLEYISGFPSANVNVTIEAQQWCVKMGVTLSAAQVNATAAQTAVAQAHVSTSVNSISQELLKSSEEKKVGMYLSDLSDDSQKVIAATEDAIAKGAENNTKAAIDSINKICEMQVAAITNDSTLTKEVKMEMITAVCEKSKTQVTEVIMWDTIKEIVAKNPNVSILVVRSDGTNVLIGNTMQMTNAILTHSIMKKTPIRQIKSKKQFDFSSIEQ